MAELTAAEITTKRDAAQSALDTLIASTSGGADETSGEQSRSTSQRMALLMKERDYWQARLDSVPSIYIDEIRTT